MSFKVKKLSPEEAKAFLSKEVVSASSTAEQFSNRAGVSSGSLPTNDAQLRNNPKAADENDASIQPIAESGQFERLDIKDPVELQAMFDPSVWRHDPQTGEREIILHDWQIELGEMLGEVKPTGTKPFKFCLCAANGSGKDAFIVAPFAAWFIVSKIRSLVIVTSSSGIQLTNQTENYIASLCRKINEKMRTQFYGKDIIKIRKRRITCLLTGSEIMLFATDEAGKAEGYHPVEPDAEMAIIVNEAKSVEKPIFGALRRCTGYNYWLNVSTPGEPRGEFYDSWRYWPNKKRVTVHDCPHQAKDEYEYDLKTLGEHDPLFRSKWLALFTSIGGRGVVNQLAWERLQEQLKAGNIPWIKDIIRIGIDIALSNHGDETVISIWSGNKQLDQVTFRINDATRLADTIERELLKHVKKTHEYIFADDGGVGRAVIDILRRRGWIGLKRVLNQSAPRSKKNFRNRGAELWYKFAKLIEHLAIIPLNDEKLHEQIVNRKYKESDQGIDKLLLESKQTCAARGEKSPDRADAAVIAFSDINIEELLRRIKNPSKPGGSASSVKQEGQANMAWTFDNERNTKQHSNFSLRRISKRGSQSKRLSKWMT